jgi:hypothetical protein
MPMGVFHFAAQSHIDVKRTLSRFGAIVSDTTTRRNLISMTTSSLVKLRTMVAQARTRKEAAIGIVLDNIQNYVLVHQDGIGKAPELKVGTAATAIFLHPHAPGAFDAADHTKRVAQKLRKELTTEELYKDIDWIHIHNVGALHWVRVLVQYVPRLKGHKEEIYRLFRTAPIAKCRMPEGRKTNIQPLGTNSERGLFGGIPDP